MTLRKVKEMSIDLEGSIKVEDAHLITVDQIME